MVYASKLKVIYQFYITQFYEKNYAKEKNTQKPTLTILYFCKIISIFYYNYSEKPIAITLLIDFTSPMAKPIAKPKVEALTNNKILNIKQKQGRLTKNNSTNKYIKKS